MRVLLVGADPLDLVVVAHLDFAVIDAIDKALPGRQLLVLPGRGTTAMWRMRRFVPGVTRRLFRLIYGF